MLRGNRKPIEVHFAPDVPAPAKALVRKYLPPLLPFIPGEIVELNVTWEPDAGDSLATMETDRRYRRCKLIIHASLLGVDDEECRVTFAHEVAHTIIGPVALVGLRAIDQLTEESEEKPGPWRTTWGDANEMVAEDLGRLLRRLAWPVLADE